MNEGQIIADFVTANFEKIIAIGRVAYGKADAAIQVRLKTAYEDYIRNTRLKYSKSKSFFIRSQPVELYSYYVPTGISCGARDIIKPTFDECTEFTNRIVITGTGGSGKSVLIRHLFLDCIAKGRFAPILIELRDLNAYDKSVDDYIGEILSEFGFEATEPYIQNAKEAGHFCFFFDGFDEVTQKLRTKILKQMLALSKRFIRCPIFISSRPDDILGGIDDFSTFKINPLRLGEALELVKKLPFEEVTKRNFSSDLSNGLFEKHESFLSNPLLLSIMLLTYGENAEIPSKLSVFYNQAYEALFHKHDAQKGGYRRGRLTAFDIQDFAKIFSLFCLQTYEKRQFKMSRTQCVEFIRKSAQVANMDIESEDYLTDLLSAACLLIEDGLEIAFSHRSFQEYFVALQISNSSPDIQVKLIDRYWKNIRQDNVVSLLWEINPDLVERILIIPKLDELFNKIGVKRKVGITHLVRFVKYYFSTINVDANELSFTYHNSNSDAKVAEISILAIAVKHYAKYIIPPREQADLENVEIYRKYSRGGRRAEHKTSEITIRSPLIADIDNRDMWMSVKYLSAGFDAYKALKTKHMNSNQSFDVLLGIK